LHLADSTLDPIVECLQLDLRPPAAAFRRSLEGLVATMALPFQMAAAGVISQRFQALHAAERIRALDREDRGEPEEIIREATQRIAHERLQGELHSEAGTAWFRDTVLDRLAAD